MIRTMTTAGSGGRAPDYQSLAWFRHLIRRFLVFSEGVARGAGLHPQQHQLLLAAKGLRPDEQPTIGTLAWKLQLKHHTVVGLVDRLTALGMVRRHRSAADGRQVLVAITALGEAVLRRLSITHRKELQRVAPLLLPALRAIFDPPREKQRKRRRSPRTGAPS